MKAAELRASILQEAVFGGKFVQQIGSEYTADELLKQSALLSGQ